MDKSPQRTTHRNGQITATDNPPLGFARIPATFEVETAVRKYLFLL
jgi:hypothetical protein